MVGFTIFYDLGLSVYHCCSLCVVGRLLRNLAHMCKIGKYLLSSYNICLCSHSKSNSLYYKPQQRKTLLVIIIPLLSTCTMFEDDLFTTEQKSIHQFTVPCAIWNPVPGQVYTWRKSMSPLYGILTPLHYMQCEIVNVHCPTASAASALRHNSYLNKHIFSDKLIQN
jgi:hypothetical protein